MKSGGLIEVHVTGKGPITKEAIISTVFDFILIAKHRVEQHMPFEEIAGPLGQAEFWLGELQSYRVS